MTGRRRAAVLAAACAALTGVVFLPCAAFPFLNWDDGVNVAANPHLTFSGPGLWWMATGSALGHWHPLTWLTFAWDRAVWGANPLGYHLTNVLLHAASAALFFLLARRLLRPAAATAAAAEGAAFFAALFWACHPLRVESVAWVTERRDVLSGFFVLASLLAYVRGATEGDGERGRSWRRAALALGAAAMASKVFAIVLPAVLLVLDARLRGRPRWKEKLPWALPAAAALAFNLSAQSAGEASVTLARFGLESRLAQAAYGLAFYAERTVFAAGLGPPYERSPLLEPLPFFVSAAAVLAAAALIWRSRRRFPWLAQAALVYVLFALPALGLFKSGRMTAADRYSYLPGLPLALLAGAAVARSARRRGPALAAFSLVALLAALTLGQLPVWSSDTALWTRACAVSPLSYFARLKLAEADSAAGRRDAAAADRAEAERLHAEVFTRAAAIYAARGDQAAAADALARVKAGLASFAPER